MPSFSLAQIHALRACSLLVIPPPRERVPLPRGFLTDLSDLNLLSWAGLVQDVASGLLALPPNLGSDTSLPVVTLLELLEKTTGWGYCHFCFHLVSRCICMGAYSPVPPLSWSQVVEELPGYGVTATSGDMMAPSTTAAGMSGYIPPPLGLPLPPEAPASRGLPTAPPSLPGARRSTSLRGMLRGLWGHRWCSVWVVWPNGCQHHPHRHLSTNHDQGGQPCHISKWYNRQRSPWGGELLLTPPTNKTTPKGSASSQDHGRPTMKGQGDGS